MSFELIETVTVGAGGASSIEFTSIPQDGTDLVLKLSLRGSNNEELSFIRVNGVFGSGAYTGIQLLGNGSTATSANRNSILYLYGVDNSFTASTFSNSEIYYSNYTSNTTKSISVDFTAENNATVSFTGLIAMTANTTSPITSVEIVHPNGTYVINSTASLYKITAS